MAKIDKKYHELLQHIIDNGFKYEDPNRKGVLRRQISSYQIVHDFTDGFPAITTKKLFWKGIVGELLWFLKGDTNIKYLINNGINIWNKDAYNWLIKTYPQSEGETPSYEEVFKNPNSWNLDLGRVYGAQWRNWKGSIPFIKKNGKTGYDQIANLIQGLKETPMGTKHIVTAWNPAELNDMALPPCHWSFEILVEPLTAEQRDNIYEKTGEKEIGFYNCGIPKYQITLKWHQRSVDTFLGLPFNIASYALLAHIIGKLTNMIPKGVIGDLSNVHIYEPHMDAVKEQLSRYVNKYNGLKTKVVDFHDIKEHYENKGLDDLLNELNISENFILKNYKSYPSIPAEMLAYS